MKEKELEFLREYKELCLKHKMWVGGFDHGAYLRDMTDDEYKLKCLAFTETVNGDGSVSQSNLRFCEKSDFEKSCVGLNFYSKG